MSRQDIQTEPNQNDTTRSRGESQDQEDKPSPRSEVNPPYLSLTPEQRRKMKQDLGIDDYDELEQDVPESLKTEFSPELPPEAERYVLDWHSRTSQKNRTADELTCFLGGGIYDHFVPSTVSALMGREEFLTSYTPYQAEMNQGSLQSMFEFQSMISEIMQLPVTNASMYDGATALAEACLMAINTTRRDTIYYSPNLYDSWIGVLKSYARPHGWELKELPTDDGIAHYPENWNDEPAAVCMGYPNKYGSADQVHDWNKNRPDDKTVGILGVNPLAMTLLKPPGDLGWDVAVGEGQSLGLPMQCGAPQVGLFSARERFLRRMPGRLVGETKDRRGNRCYVLTLQTREQHIRRERATSNICTNHALLTIGIAVSLATQGPRGLRKKARLNHENGKKLQNHLNDRFEIVGDPLFNEITIEVSKSDELNRELKQEGFMGGFWDDDRYVCAATERRSDEEIENFARAVSSNLE